MSTAWTLFAILIGGELFGFTGMILGVPVFAVVYSLIREFVYKKLNMKEEIQSCDTIDVKQPCEREEENHEALQEDGINKDGM